LFVLNSQTKIDTIQNTKHAKIKNINLHKQQNKFKNTYQPNPATVLKSYDTIWINSIL